MAPALKIITAGLIGWKVAQIGVNLAMRANPLGLIITGITLLVGGIATAWKRFAVFRAVVLTAWDSLKTFWQTIKDGFLSIIPKLLSGLGSLGRAFHHLFAGNFGKALEAAQTGIKHLFDASPTGVLARSVKAAADTFSQKFQPTLKMERQREAGRKAFAGSVRAGREAKEAEQKALLAKGVAAPLTGDPQTIEAATTPASASAPARANDHPERHPDRPTDTERTECKRRHRRNCPTGAAVLDPRAEPIHCHADDLTRYFIGGRNMRHGNAKSRIAAMQDNIKHTACG